MHKYVVTHLIKFVEEADKLNSSGEIDRWYRKVETFFRTAIGEDEAKVFKEIYAFNDWDQHAMRVGHLLELIAKSEAQSTIASSAQTVYPIQTTNSNKVFVVHGHDNEAKEGTARLLEKIGLHAIILHEQPNSGRAIIEKFENYSGDIAFAVILLTPDDVGGLATEPKKLKARARQNVIMELGYFMGRLGRSRVCALYKGGVELPSDYQGVLYIEIDSAGAWKTKLAQEFVQAKVPIELSGIINS